MIYLLKRLCVSSLLIGVVSIPRLLCHIVQNMTLFSIFQILLSFLSFSVSFSSAIIIYSRLLREARTPFMTALNTLLFDESLQRYMPSMVQGWLAINTSVWEIRYCGLSCIFILLVRLVCLGLCGLRALRVTDLPQVFRQDLLINYPILLFRCHLLWNYWGVQVFIILAILSWSQEHHFRGNRLFGSNITIFLKPTMKICDRIWTGW